MQEIASPLEASVSSQDPLQVPPEQQAGENTLQLQLQPSLALWHALQRYASCSAHFHAWALLGMGLAHAVVVSMLL